MVDDFKTIVETDKEVSKRKKIAEVKKRQKSQAYTFVNADSNMKKAGHMSRPRSNTLCTTKKVKTS